MTTTTDPIAAYAAQTQAALAAAQAKKSANELGIDEFLTLMTAQLKNQDPLKPLDGTQFVAQLAQFGTVSGVQEMQTSIETLASSLRATQTLNGATMVGRDILAAADSFTHAEGGSVNGQLEVPSGAASVQVRITDSTGAVVRELSVPAEAGTATFTWDGRRSDGTLATSGEYDIEAIANIGGERGSLGVLLAGRVGSISLDASGTELTLNTSTLGPISMNNVRRVM
jgi:flagellar basal-body rod modification protein FlgD